MTLVRFSTMSSDRYRELLDMVGLTPTGAGPFFGYDDRSARRWSEDALPIPIAVAALLEVMVVCTLNADDVRAITSKYQPERERDDGDHADGNA
jgi:hypothetical protein